MAADRYLAGMPAHFKYFATWLPNASVSLGDVGVLEERVFTRVTSLQALEIPFAETDASPAADYEMQSDSGATIELGVHAGPDGARGKASVQFSEKGGFVFQARSGSEKNIQDTNTLGAEILAAFGRGEWKKEWVVVDSVVSVENMTVLVSQSETAGIEFALDGPLPPSLPLASPGANLSIVSMSGAFVRVVGATAATPMYRVSRLSRAFWAPFKSPELKRVRRGVRSTSNEAAAQVPVPALTRVEWDELEGF